MTKPQLVAETPRAGKLNHRFLAAANSTLSDSEVSQIVATARKNQKGDNYLAVTVDTAQPLSGRTGKEILVLVGINVKKLSEIQHQQILEQLEQRLTDLATLVTEKIDWDDRKNQALLLKHPELGKWETDFSDLSVFQHQRIKWKNTQALLIKHPELSKWGRDFSDLPMKPSAVQLVTENMARNDNNPKSDLSVKPSAVPDTNPLDLPTPQRFKVIYGVIILLLCLGLLGIWALTQPNEEIPKSPITQEDPYIKLDRAICQQYKHCNNTQALRDFESDPDKIEQVLSDLDSTDVWSFLLSFVDDSHRSQQAYLGDLADFDKSKFDQIIDQQQKLRTVFLDFQNMTKLDMGLSTPPNSENYPVLSFVYKVSKNLPNLPKMEEQLPFFTNDDMLRAQFLGNIIEYGRDNTLIDEDRKVKVFDALCQLSDEKTVKTTYHEKYGLKELCTHTKCESLNTDDQKDQADAFLKLRTNLNEHLECSKRLTN